MHITSAVEPAHAKVNLLLRILARESSGYHSIETLFQRLALHDIVSVHVERDGRSLECVGPTMPAGGLGAPEQNLAWRAADLYARETGWDTGWHIDIEKRIPVGGGLGGGSTDAAAVLRAMESLSPMPMGLPRLLELGGQLGADVPFFVAGHSRAWAWGRGDRLLALRPLPTAFVRLFIFEDGVNTGAAYGALAARRAESHEVAAPARCYVPEAFDDWASIAQLAANDFEAVVPSMHQGVAAVLPVVRQVATEMRATGLPAIGMLSGSGATCFLLTVGISGFRQSEAGPIPVRIVETHTN